MSKKILLADDSITIQKVIELTFSDEDFDVITVGNGRLALERLPEVRPDIVLCDIIMPEKDGYEVCEQIKTSPATAHIPVLLLTGAFEPFDQERAARAGYDGSLAKPFEPETLIAKVKELLARAPARAPLVAAPPAARPAAPAPPAPAPAPAVLPFQRPAPAAPRFAPEESFASLGEAEPAGAAPDAFAPMTDEESATLLAPPAPPSPDSASTVMFQAAQLPWNAPATPAAVRPPVAEARPSAAPLPAPEPVFVPVASEAPAAVEEPTVFEEVLEEDLDFGEASVEPSAADTLGAEPFSLAGSTLPPIPPAEDATRTGAFEPVLEEAAAPAPEPPPAPPFEPEPAPVFPPEPVHVFESEPVPAFEPEPAPVFEPEPAPSAPARPHLEPGPRPAAWAPEPAPPVAPPAPPPPAAPVASESFADVAAAVAPPASPAPPPSEAAGVSVPLEMVEKIAQRVIAQISEKTVREIAWEVIPDLAEALIKQEIERLKAELAKL
ncbi:MAG TPA: response regulator [Vicinamibacteria bacterium]|nr:response regulator [Vicinamibacteria bacterium]